MGVLWVRTYIPDRLSERKPLLLTYDTRQDKIHATMYHLANVLINAPKYKEYFYTCHFQDNHSKQQMKKGKDF